MGSGNLTRQPHLLPHPRWLCAIHACDAVFFHSRRSMAVPFHQSARAHALLEQLATVVEAGYEAHTLQR